MRSLLLQLLLRTLLVLWLLLRFCAAAAAATAASMMPLLLQLLCVSERSSPSLRHGRCRGYCCSPFPAEGPSLPPPLLLLLSLLLQTLRLPLLQMLLCPLFSGRTSPFHDLRQRLPLQPLLVLRLLVRLLLRLLIGCCDSGCCRVCWCCLPREKCRLTPRNLLKGFTR